MRCASLLAVALIQTLTKFFCGWSPRPLKKTYGLFKMYSSNSLAPSPWLGSSSSSDDRVHQHSADSHACVGVASCVQLALSLPLVWLPGASARRAVCPWSSWRAIWWSCSRTPPRSPCPGWGPTWPARPPSSRAPEASLSSPSSGSCAPCPTQSTPPPRWWRAEVSHLTVPFS
jgi:hypothetical protein